MEKDVQENISNIDIRYLLRKKFKIKFRKKLFNV